MLLRYHLSRFLYLKNTRSMIRCLLLSLCAIVINGSHFNGGTIRWVPVNPQDNSTTVTITIVQSYSWSYPSTTCANNVPISTPLRASQNSNLTCIANCLTDGGYSNKPIDILTDCTSSTSALGVMTSQKSKNVTVSSGAYFSVAYRGGAWVGLGNPVLSSLSWSIVSSIDLRLRPDGIINTSPIANVFSPRYAIVNQITIIPIAVSDVNTGDDIRCRWSIKSITPLIDECNGICYPANIPSNTNLSNCTVTFRGLVVGVWYAAAIQVRENITSIKLTTIVIFTIMLGRNTDITKYRIHSEDLYFI